MMLLLGPLIESYTLGSAPLAPRAACSRSPTVQCMAEVPPAAAAERGCVAEAREGIRLPAKYFV